jgi:hypothetical protein
MWKYLFILLFYYNSWAQNPKISQIYDELDGMDLVEALIKDQQYGLADNNLQGLPDRSNDFDRFQFLQGEIYYYTGQKDGAYEKYKSISLNKKSRFLRKAIVRLAQIEKSRKNWSSCLSRFSFVDDKLNRDEVLLKAICYQGMRRWEAAYDLYSEPDFNWDIEFVTHRLEILTELKLFETAKIVFYAYLERTQEPIEALTLLHQFRERALPGYQVLLEAVKLKFPGNIDVMNTAVSLYYEKQWTLNMIEELRNLTNIDSKYHEYLAEALRIQQKTHLTFFHQIQIKDNEKKYRNQIADYSEQKKWGMILSLEKGYGRSVKQIEGGLAYTFAYSHLKYKHFAKSRNYLFEIATDQMVLKKKQLNQVIEACESENNNCQLSRL